ncbi:hypothetical protein BGZ61DRAFT_473101 [Ilyonectria robusta]|uniref:uncharacterized protein n=1 Tax=Ilyonectria robusta TaxID=1079257 RepID=UPI001E8DF701|nr:uncharacterized protein BGZ61DRAFT_473101 [Ilyonectria robusta]KAH8734359.1 hypothetical protein BGZ61DRAFT_473101 [Ilyonectria robusta]
MVGGPGESLQAEPKPQIDPTEGSVVFWGLSSNRKFSGQLAIFLSCVKAVAFCLSWNILVEVSLEQAFSDLVTSSTPPKRRKLRRIPIVLNVVIKNPSMNCNMINVSMGSMGVMVGSGEKFATIVAVAMANTKMELVSKTDWADCGSTRRLIQEEIHCRCSSTAEATGVSIEPAKV